MNTMTPQQKEAQGKQVAELTEFIEKTKFPGTLVHACFDDWLIEALKHESQRTLECKWPMLKSLMQTSACEFTLAQMGNAINAIESKTPAQLNVPDAEYIMIQDHVQTLAEKWNQIVNAMKETIQAKHKPSQIVQSKTKQFRTYGK